MILINNQWEQVKDIDDVYRIASEFICKEFADGIKSIFDKNIFDIQNKINELEDEIVDLEDEKKSLENQLDEEQNAYEELKEVIDKFKDALDDAAYNVVSYKHPNCYDFSEYKKYYLKELADSNKIPNKYMPN